MSMGNECHALRSFSFRIFAHTKLKTNLLIYVITHNADAACEKERN